ncbi:MAG TPA: glycosidase [Cellulomonas sp.]
MNASHDDVTVPYALTRTGVLMVPDPDRPEEAEGVLNPATAWGADGELYLFPRLVAAGNVSRVGRARVVLAGGVPVDVERRGVVLAPDRAWERGARHGGVEDPRITWVPSLGLHVMTYVAYGPLGPRPALAVSEHGESWRRLGPVQFEYDDALDTDLNLFPNKDVVLFPEPVPGPDGRACYAMLHRPMWDFSFVRPGEPAPLPAGLTDDRAGIWISYVDADRVRADITALAHPSGHRFVAGPAMDWEALKIGAGPAPVRIPEGWLVLHHGVTGELTAGGFTPQQNVRYVAGALVLDAADPSRVLARTSRPLLEPATEQETAGTVSNVVFPTAAEVVDGVTYVFYGMADSAIGVARLDRVDGR